ncbi:serine/threonine-protein kinase [Luteolibacter sp. LG18]|uniref:serine/threonine protein kinase n=1 Tax=Luteolibacter sp. LG18 TaxID=2819286 RepID=UPI0030C6E2EE
MNPSIEKLYFAAASGLTPEERERFLDHACREEPALRRRLERLFTVLTSADTFFELQPEVEPDPGGVPVEEGLGAHIGRYRLIERLGDGGYGVVYFARQQEPVQRNVALKIIKIGMDTESVIASFDMERQALAMMDHPNIAKVLDAGATAAGRPYFVMELVDGEKITEFCDANRLSIRQRLELFTQVCRAIQHAHQKGVIHRDIKPSNVLVRWDDGVATPKVIDFGIAKATAATEGHREIAAPGGHFVGTPAYMSPEQAEGSLDVDTRSDVYGLGVLLYELLCGRTPFDALRCTECPADEVRRTIREEKPKWPGAAFKSMPSDERALVAANRGTTVAGLESDLAGDLDWIVAKAIEKDRTRRYETATGVAMDVERFFHDEPVIARPPLRLYRLGKLLRRNKLTFAAGSVVVLALLAGFGTSTWMYYRERHARQEQARLRQVAEFRERIAQAAVKIKYGDLAAADRILAEIPVHETPSSLEAASDFGTVANWHVQAERLNEAALRFASMARAISSVDDADLPSVSFELLPVAATVAYTQPPQAYEEIRALAIKRFGATSNAVVAEQVLKSCILRPPDPDTLRALAPLAASVERAIPAKPPAPNNHNSAWSTFAMSLWYYRSGDLATATAWGKRCLSSSNQNEARAASVLVVSAMIEKRAGRTESARAALADGRGKVQAALTGKRWLTEKSSAYWFDWLNAAVLLSEAESVVGNP